MRRREGGPNLTSCFAAIYDAWPRDGAPMIDRVEWLTPQLADPFCVAARIRIGGREDVVYSSTDDTTRTVAGMHMRGRVAVLSRRGGEVAWSYVYGAGQIQADGFTLAAPTDVRVPLQKVLRTADGAEDALEVAAELPEGDALKGIWLRVVHGDGSANGYRIESIAKTPAGSRIRIHDEPGFQMTPNGMRMLFFPKYEIPGKQWVEICVPRFVKRQP